MGRSRLTEGRDGAEASEGISSPGFFSGSVNTMSARVAMLAALALGTATCDIPEQDQGQSAVEVKKGPSFGSPMVRVDTRGIDVMGTIDTEARMLLEVFNPQGEPVLFEDHFVGPGKFRITKAFSPGMEGGTVILSDEKGESFSFNIEKTEPIQDPPTD